MYFYRLRSAIFYICFCIAGLISVSEFSNAQVLAPPYFNLALNRRVFATATCGVPNPELYCKLNGADSAAILRHELLIQGQLCDYCNASNPEDDHSPEKAVDGLETWWQSPPLSRGSQYNEVNLTVELGQEFHVAYVIVKMGNSPRPGVWALERSKDNGKTFLPWQYFASSREECRQYFGNNVSFEITQDDTVICTTEFSRSIVPLEGGEIIVRLVQNRPTGEDFFNSIVLQEWTIATDVRFRLMKIKNVAGHSTSVDNQDTTTTRRYFYSIKEISIGGRCRCNGHADTCTSIDQNDPYKLVCDCKDNTCGSNCETCCPGFEQKKWSQSKTNKKFVCEPCNCNRHSDRCTYNETVDNFKLSMDIHGNYEGGGVCQNCQDNTEGINCDKCVPGYYRPYGKKVDDYDVCRKCQCDFIYSTGNCEDGTGRCECKLEYTKPKCDSCSYGHYGYPICRPCDCNINGTISATCIPENGQCPCKRNFDGPYCRTCAAGYYNYPMCEPCACYNDGSVSNFCDINSGECKCKSNFGGKNCNKCSDGYYGFPTCSYCNCDIKGTVAEVCSKTDGHCLCKPGYGGPRCDQCLANFTGFPDCKPCNCSSIGSAFTVCDASGKCSCFSNYGGKQCNQCSPGYYQYPNCTACNCDPEGTIGITCNDDGVCVCKPNFEGEKCNECKRGYYNYPYCEECTYNPAGVKSTFTGCSSTGAQPLIIECKSRVTGKQCNDCKEPYWNLQITNPDGCEECGCNRNGTIGGLVSCDTKLGQCFCKTSVTSRQCDQCADGYYSLSDDNLFGCTECDCDVGGAINNVCNKATGQCHCQPRVGGRMCRKPLEVHYFPTLHQLQYEIEDGYTPSLTPVRYGFEEHLFPKFSWRGYGVFSQLQNETIHEIDIPKSSLYRIVLHYVNPNKMAVSGTVSVSSDSSNSVDSEQKFQVLFKPTSSPTFVTVAGILGNNPSTFVMDSGQWTLKIKIEKSLFLDYLVLIPAEYYEGSLLVSEIIKPCTIDQSDICKHYMYPNVSKFDYVRGAGGYINNGDSRSPVKHYFHDYQSALGLPKIPILSNDQPALYLDMILTRPGQYVLIIIYATTKSQERTTVHLEARTQSKSNTTLVTIYNCRYSSLCRQVALDRNGTVQIFDFDKNFVKLILKGTGNGIGIDSVIAIPSENWSLGYIQSTSSCLMKDKTCIPDIYSTPPDSRRIDFKTDNEDQVSKVLPSTIFDNSTKLIFWDSKKPMLDLKGKVGKSGSYVFVVHYYQPDYPEFDADVLVQNGIFYEAKLPVKHCPNVAGCRSTVKQANGNNIFQLLENFIFSVKVSNQKHIWLHYLLVIPSTLYTEQVVTEQPFDQTTWFISQCGNNSFFLNTSEEGFCRDATFSLTTKFNHGTLPCGCDFEGSKSFECAQFGGQCPCQPNVIGRKCNSCKTGYFGFPNCESCNCPLSAYCDANTGDCICPPNVLGDKCNRCRPYTYGLHPVIGCVECNCNFDGVKDNNLQCDLQNGACDCKENIEGRTCDHCIAGYSHFPHCKPCGCDLRGTIAEVCNKETGNCTCKQNVQGIACDVCKDGTFNLQSENENGCTDCFCFGRTTRCSQSVLYVKWISLFDNWLLAVINTSGKIIEINNLPTEIEITDPGMQVNLGYILQGISYFVAPEPYLGNKLTSYGNYLNYTLHYSASEDGKAVGGPDIILYGANVYLMYESVEAPSTGINFLMSLKIVESNFLTASGNIATRGELMRVLQNLTSLYIKATYSDRPQITKLLSITLEVAEKDYNPYSNIALSVEECHCPPNYIGLSCEECADGYYRLTTDPLGGICAQCQCNGHATTCDKVTGVCHNCKHNTKGNHCEKCEVGYYGNATQGAPNDCLICACPLPVPSNNFATGCEINEYGDKIICDCTPGYTGDRCEKCAPGYYGRPEVNGEICVACDCNGNINASEPGSCDHITGRCIKCLNNTYGDSCERCAPGYFGDAINAKNCQPCDCDKCGTQECDHRTGQCTCLDNVVGEKCDRCADNHYGFTTCEGCSHCNCQEASESLQCEDRTGDCRCKPGVTGKMCDRCIAGYWKYTANGCTSCGCNSGYSVGVGCNVNTGMCQCLPNVVGDKCNQCPYRWVLIPAEGCFPCDKCTDGLLDVIDVLQMEFSPIYDKFHNASVNYFTVQRLKFINETANRLAPNVSDVLSYRFDLTPYIRNITFVENEVENARRAVQSVLNDVQTSSKNGNMTLENAHEIERLIIKVMDRSGKTVQEMNNLVYSLETVTVRQSDDDFRDAENIKNEIENNFDLNKNVKKDGEETLYKAKNLTDSILELRKPVFKTSALLENVKLKKESLDKKFDDLEEFEDKAQRAATQTKDIIHSQKKVKVSDRVESIVNITTDAQNTVQRSRDLEKNTTTLLEKAKENFEDLITANEKITEKESNAHTYQTELIKQLEQAQNDVLQATNYANALQKQAQILESISKDQVSTEAANAYSNIVNAVNDASINTTKAQQNIELAAEKSKDLPEKIRSSQFESSTKLSNAQAALDDVQENLIMELDSSMQKHNKLMKLLNFNNIDNIQKQLKDLENQNIIDKLEKLKPDEVFNESKDILKRMEELVNLPKKLEKARNLFDDRNNKKKTAQELGIFVEGIKNKIPEIKDKIDSQRNELINLKLNDTMENIDQTLFALKQNISRARDLAAKIKLGITLSPKTTLELPVPANLLDQGSSTDLSMYFNTNESNALLFYIGNEAVPRQKRDTMRNPKADDYLALVLSGGYPTLIVNLGEKQTSKIAVQIKIIPHEWYNVKIARTGKLTNLTIIDSRGNDYYASAECKGVHSVLNLDKDHSKFFIGGLPPSFEAPSSIEYTTYSGQMQDVTVNGEPIGLWNFIEILKPDDVPLQGAINGSVERSVLLQKTSTACRFAGNGFVKLLANRYMTSELTVVVMRIKTSAEDGLIFLTCRDQTFISIELHSGFIYFQYNVGKGLKSLTSGTQQYNDGKWHVIEISRWKNTGALKIDGEELQKEDSDKSDIFFELPEYIFIGGYEGEHTLTDVIKKSFEGCIDDLRIKGEAVVNLENNPDAYKVIPGCTDQFLNYLSFGDHGYVRWPNPNIEYQWKSVYNIELSLRIKTSVAESLIVYGTDGYNSFCLQLSNGAILFTSGSQKVDTGPNMKYNDNRWHSIMAIHDFDMLHLIVDDFEIFKSPLIRSETHFGSSVSLYFGSVPPNVDASAAIKPSFTGCIADATFNGKNVNFEDVWEGISAIIGKCSGLSKDIKPKSLESTTMTIVTVFDPDLTPESGQRFGTAKDSALLYDFNSRQFGGQLLISLDIRTIVSDGIIFYVYQPQENDFVALYLRNSNLSLRYQCGDNADTLSIPMVNQAEWHTVKFTINIKGAKLNINDNSEKWNSVGCSSINISPPYFVGGIIDQVVLKLAKMHLEGLNENFVGCLRNFKSNGNVNEKPKSIGVIPCSSKVEEGTFFPSDGAYLRAYENYNVGAHIVIRMQIKPRNVSGLLIAVHSNSKKDFLMLRLDNGSLNFTIENGNRPRSAIFTPTSPSFFINGEWHDITAYKHKDVMLLKVGNYETPRQHDYSSDTRIDTHDPLFIGGYPPKLSKALGISTDYYVGCMRKVEINDKIQKLSSFTPFGNVMFNVCPTI